MVRPVKRFVGLKNYIDMLTDPLLLKIIGNTFLYILIMLILCFAAPYVFSFILSIVIKRGKNFYKSVFFLPSVISLVVGTMIFIWLLNPLSGPVAKIARLFGISVPIWGQTEGLVIFVLTVITSWKVYGYNFIVVLAGISGISREVIEAARIDNIPTWRIFFEIVIPMSSATGIYVLILTIVQGMQYVFTPIRLVTGGGPDHASSNIIYNVYNEAFRLFNTGLASAYAIVTILLFAILLFLEFKFVEKGVYYEN
jgi:sn-glycerol 3-phosphate transport system permease protein